MDFLTKVLYIFEYLADYGQMSWNKATLLCADEFGIPTRETERVMAFMVFELMLKETVMPHPLQGVPPVRGVEAVEYGYALICPEMADRYPLFFLTYEESILKRKQDNEDDRNRRANVKRLEAIPALKRQLASTRFIVKKLEVEIENARERILLGYGLYNTSDTLADKEQLLIRARTRLDGLKDRIEDLEN